MCAYVCVYIYKKISLNNVERWTYYRRTISRKQNKRLPD